MELHYCVDDYCLSKIDIAALFAGVHLNKTMVSAKAIAEEDSRAKSVVLSAEGAKVSGHNAVLRYLGGMSLGLLGETAMDQASVDQWLETCWQELEIPLQVLLALQSSANEFEMPPEKQHSVETKAKHDISTTLAKLEQHIASRTFFASERISIADISLYAAVHAALALNPSALSSSPSLFRWFMTVGHNCKVHAVRPLPKAILDSAPTLSVCADDRFATPSVIGNDFSVAPPSAKWRRNRIRVKELLAQGEAAIGQEVNVKGWIRTCRSADRNQLLFVELTDGSTVKGLQLVLNLNSTAGMTEVANSGGVGASISVTGQVVASPAKGQTVELHATSAEVLGAVYGGENGEIGGKNYPMSKKAHSLEFLREKAHLRTRSRVFSSAMRMRHAMAFATHKFFNDRGFLYSHTPLITAADCEGAGEQFVVTTLLPDHAKSTDIPTDKAGFIDYSKDFFARRCCLTVSGQLNVETHACALSDVYTFGPAFRAEVSHTSRHLSEFWMIEPEMCFADLQDNMALAEDYVRYCAAYALEHCKDDLAYFEDEYPGGEKGLRERLRNVTESEFARITYTEAIELLQRDAAAGAVTFERIPSWGDDLNSEHERYMAEAVFCRPTIVTDYPRAIKSFYMKVNPDGQTVAAMDILVPKIGELVGGSQREDNLETLTQRCKESGLHPEDIWWYLDLRRYGSVPHSGFGLGFERLIMFVTGLENIRDVIPFPRVPGHADF